MTSEDMASGRTRPGIVASAEAWVRAGRLDLGLPHNTATLIGQLGPDDLRALRRSTVLKAAMHPETVRCFLPELGRDIQKSGELLLKAWCLGHFAAETPDTKANLAAALRWAGEAAAVECFVLACRHGKADVADEMLDVIASNFDTRLAEAIQEGFEVACLGRRLEIAEWLHGAGGGPPGWEIDLHRGDDRVFRFSMCLGEREIAEFLRGLHGPDYEGGESYQRALDDLRQQRWDDRAGWISAVLRATLRRS